VRRGVPEAVAEAKGRRAVHAGPDGPPVTSAPQRRPRGEEERSSGLTTPGGEMSDKVGAFPPRLHSIAESYWVTRSPRGDVGQDPSARPAVRQAVRGGRVHNRSWPRQRRRLSLFSEEGSGWSSGPSMSRRRQRWTR
jgi:hypothetical protein